MILAAGLGTRLLPLTQYRPKPALPVLDRPVIAYLMALLARHGVREILVNRHHLADALTRAIEAHVPKGVTVVYSDEPRPLGTGGGLRQAASFLSASDPSLVLAGDMLFDVDLSSLRDAHLAGGHRVSLVLRDDPRADTFGTIGLDDLGRVRRIASRFDLGGETRAGVFTGMRLFSPSVYQDWPREEAFEDLSDWLAPQLAAGADDIRGIVVTQSQSIWEPVGTPAEYLAVNLSPPPLSYMGDLPIRMRMDGERADLVIGHDARVPDASRLRRCVVWDHEVVPETFSAEGGVFAGGRFYPCETSTRGD